MKQFSLAGLLRVRGLEEQLAAAELAEANRALNNVRVRRAKTRAALAGTSVEAAGSANLAAMAASRAAGRAMLVELAALDDTARDHVEAATGAYHRARAASAGIRKLETRHVEAEIASDLHAEQAAIDEVAIGSWRRRGGAR